MPGTPGRAHAWSLKGTGWSERTRRVGSHTLEVAELVEAERITSRRSCEQSKRPSRSPPGVRKDVGTSCLSFTGCAPRKPTVRLSTEQICVCCHFPNGSHRLHTETVTPGVPGRPRRLLRGTGRLYTCHSSPPPSFARGRCQRTRVPPGGSADAVTVLPVPASDLGKRHLERVPAPAVGSSVTTAQGGAHRPRGARSCPQDAPDPHTRSQPAWQQALSHSSGPSWTRTLSPGKPADSNPLRLAENCSLRGGRLGRDRLWEAPSVGSPRTGPSAAPEAHPVRLPGHPARNLLFADAPGGPAPQLWNDGLCPVPKCPRREAQRPALPDAPSSPFCSCLSPNMQMLSAPNPLRGRVGDAGQCGLKGPKAATAEASVSTLSVNTKKTRLRGGMSSRRHGAPGALPASCTDRG